jgi:hypothetical protein
MELYDVVKKLIGPISPVGETVSDEIRLKNLQTLTRLVDDLVDDIEDVASHKDSHEYSVSKAGQLADSFMAMLRQRGD